LDHHFYAIIIVEAITVGLLEHQTNVVAVGEYKMSIQSSVVALGSQYRFSVCFISIYY
jgi:hypothetical protein